MIKLPLAVLLSLSCFFATAATIAQQQALTYLTKLTDSQTGIGAREAGSKKAQDTADYIIQTFNNIGYQVTEQHFTFGNNKTSKNIIVNSDIDKKNTIVLGAHYDSTAAKKGSLGATDNGAGVAAMLAIAKTIKNHNNLDYNIRFIAFGAEEVGLQGSKHYVQSLSNDQLDNMIAMINFDTIAGGDFVYVHSAHSTPYQCAKNQTNYNADTHIRSALLSASKKVLGEKKQYIIHPEYPGYPAGVTGAWSDHAPFACAGIPIAYVESTNFTINGKNGFDGYSQSTHPALWDCFDEANNTACNRQTESKWGNIWHTEFDNLTKLSKIFPKRVNNQVTDSVTVLIEVLTKAEQYFSVD
ncbi:M20/M25/M40 family metallo-hydrolase [Thalassotalea sp. G2M2-11]|uniref:M20/M25/M40 family metallo-hydrolase n=1 Tax=Thalassotalea sp. G2M2-11 TaxID=2787627 RepID=UPI0019D10AE8